MRLRKSVYAALSEDGGVLLDVHAGRWSQLSGTAAVALHLLLSTEDRYAAQAAYAAWYGLPSEQADCDLARVEKQLAARGVLAAAPIRPGTRRLRWRWWR